MKSLGAAVYAMALTLWVGGMWTVGCIVAPTLFYTLPDRTLAGAVAGKLFTLIAYVGIGCASYLLIYRVARFGAACFRQAALWIVLTMLILILAGEFWVQPILAGLKDQALPKQVMESLFRDRFAAWHGVASALYLVESVLGALLVWWQGRDPR